GPPAYPTSDPTPTTTTTYTAVSTAASSPYTTARLMITSISYRPYRRMATVIATGNPNSAIAALANPKTSPTGLASQVPHPPIAITSPSWLTTNRPAVNATH